MGEIVRIRKDDLRSAVQFVANCTPILSMKNIDKFSNIIEALVESGIISSTCEVRRGDRRYIDAVHVYIWGNFYFDIINGSLQYVVNNPAPDLNLDTVNDIMNKNYNILVKRLYLFADIIKNCQETASVFELKLRAISMYWPEAEAEIYSVIEKLSGQGFSICSGFFEQFEITSELDAQTHIGLGDNTFLNPVSGEIYKLPESSNPVFSESELELAASKILSILKK